MDAQHLYSLVLCIPCFKFIAPYHANVITLIKHSKMASIEKRGKHQFRVKVRRDGYETRTATFTTRAAAEAWAREIEGQIDKGFLLDTGEADNTTLGEALERYRREVTSAKRGAIQERRRIDAWKAHPLAQRTLQRLRGADLAAYRDERIAAGRSGNTVRLELAIISHLYRIARTEWGMEALRNPVEAIRKPRPSRARDRRLQDGELERLTASPSPLREAVILAVETAIRRGELAAIRREHIDRKRRVLLVPESKTGRPREIPLTAAALAAIDALPTRLDGWIFGPPKPFADWLSHAFIKRCKAAGITGLHFHDLRRESISRLFERGLSITEVQAISGHMTLQMLTVYTKHKAEHLAAKLA